MTQFDAIAKAKEQGFDGIEFTELAPYGKKGTLDEQLAYAEVLRAEAERVGIEIVAYLVGANLYTGSAYSDEIEVKRVCDQLRVAKALGAKILRHDVCNSEKIAGKTVSFERMLPTLAANVRKITEYAATLGIRTCSENHGRTFQDSDRVEKLYNTVGHDNYGLLIDFGNFACADESSAKAVSRVAPYGIHVHAKDFIFVPFGETHENIGKSFRTRGSNRLIGCAIGDGCIPNAQCVDIMKNAGYDGYITIEFEGVNDCITEIDRGLANIRKYIG